MYGFSEWLHFTENGKLDHEAFNDIFRQQLKELYPRVADPRRRAGLDEMADFDWIGYILTSLKNARIDNRFEREEAAHEIVVYLTASPGRLFRGYGPESGPLPARWKLAVANAVRNVLRSRARRARRFSSNGMDAAERVPSREPFERDEEDLLGEFRRHLRRQLGDEAVDLLDMRLAGKSFRQILSGTNFVRLGRAGVRRLADSLRFEAAAFARRNRDEALLARIERLTEVFVVPPIQPPAFPRIKPPLSAPISPVNFSRDSGVFTTPVTASTTRRLPTWRPTRRVKRLSVIE